MGFFSSIGNVLSSAASTVSSVSKSVRRGVAVAYNKAKEIAGQAVEWMATKAEDFVDNVKETWNTVKPYVAQISGVLKMAAKATTGIPWLSGALLMLDKGLLALTAFSNSPVAKKLDEAIKWSIKIAKKWQAQSRENLNKAELDEARKHQENMRAAEDQFIRPEHRQQFELASLLNDFEIAFADLEKTVAQGPENFEHYLRLRATQKLLGMAEEKFKSAKTVDDISAEDIFLVRISSDLIKPNPELSTVAAQRLDDVLSKRYGKKLLPFVFEEMIASWAKRAEELDAEWTKNNKAYAKANTDYKFLLGAQKIQIQLSPVEIEQLAFLEIEVPKMKKELEELATRQRDIDRYVNAAEGLLQVLEKTPEKIQEEDRDYLLEDSADIGKLLIRCAQNDIPYAQLSEDEQSLLTDYANIFREESKKRMEVLLEVTA